MVSILRSIKVPAICMLLSLLIVFFAVNVEAATDKQRIFDEAGLLTDHEINTLENIAQKSSDHRETDFIILTTIDADGKDIIKYMQDLYDQEGFGYDKEHGNAAILTIDMSERDIYLAGFYKGETYLADDRLDMIRDKITPDLSSENYFKAFESFVITGDEYMGYRPGVNPENIFFKWWFQIFASLVIALIVIFVMVFNTGGKVTTTAGTYRDSNHSKVLQKKDRYLRKTVTKRRKPKQSSGGGRSGGGGGMTSGGHSHSGSRGKF